MPRLLLAACLLAVFFPAPPASGAPARTASRRLLDAPCPDLHSACARKCAIPLGDAPPLRGLALSAALLEGAGPLPLSAPGRGPDRAGAPGRPAFGSLPPTFDLRLSTFDFRPSTLDPLARLALGSAPIPAEGGSRTLASIIDGPPHGSPDVPRLLITWGIATAVAAGYLAYGFDKWWDDTLEPFHYTNEGNLQEDSYVGGADKFGHAWGCHFLQRGSSALLRWSGVDRWLSEALAFAAVQALFLFAEIEDAYFDYGWSDGDMAANLIGGLFAAALDLVPWLDALLDFRLWYQATPYIHRRDFNVAEDYSGQKYFLVLKGAGIPFLKDTGFGYLELFAGYHAPGYRRYREVKERRVFVGFSLDVGRAIADLLFPALDPPQCVRGWTAFVFEHWHPHFIHAPLAEGVVR